MKVNIRQLLVLLFMLCAAGTTRAQQAFSLEQAKAYAMNNSWTIRNASLDVASARKKVWETISTGLPQVSGSANYTNYLNLPVSLVPGEFFGGEPGTYMSVKFGQDYNADFGFKVDQLLFDGSYIVGIGSAKLYLQLATQTEEKNQIEISHAVEQAYYAVLIAKQNLDVMTESLANNQKQQSDTKAQYENGFVEEQDVDQMKLMVQQSENEILRTEREIRVAEMVLKYTMGLDVNSSVELTDKLDTFLGQVLAAGDTGASFDYTAHIDYRMLDSQRQAQFKLLRLEQSAYLPRLSAFYNYSKMAYGDTWNLFKSNVSWFPSSMWGLNVSVPIFASGGRMAKVKQARFELEKAENNQRQAEQTLAKDYLTATADMESAADQYQNSDDNKGLARRIYEKTQIKYNNGLVSSAELAVAESQFITAQANWVSAAMQLFTAKINLDKALGK